MKPKLDPASQRSQGQLFDDTGPALVDFIDMKNPLVRLADSMQWELFEDHWRTLYGTAGGPRASALLEKLRGKLVAFMQEHELSIRQTYSRQGPRTAQQVGRYAHAKQFKRMRRLLRKQRT